MTSGGRVPGGRVALVLVSHSAALAAGTAELAAQMAPDVMIRPAGGDDEGGLGTSFALISEALTQADSEAGTVVLYDLGSAKLTTDTALEFLDQEEAARVTVVDAPLVEGALAAAVAAQAGSPRPEVAAAARRAAAPADVAAGEGLPASGAEGTTARRIAAVHNRLGLHARPVAELIRAASGFDAQVQIGRPGEPLADLHSLLAVVSLAIRGGEEAEVVASGPGAQTAADRIAALIEAGFGEPGEPASEPSGAVHPARRGEAGGTAGDGGQGPGRGSAPGGDAGTIWAADPGSPGQAIGPAVLLAGLEVPERAGAGAAAEGERLAAAIGAADASLAGRRDPLGRAHAALVRDPLLSGRAQDGLDRGLAAESAWWQAVQDAAGQLAGSGDELVAARAVDIREAGAAVLDALGFAADRVPPADALRGAIVIAGELGPGEMTRVAERGGAAVILSGGSATAHAVLVARNLGLPLVLGAGLRAAGIAPGTVLHVNGTTGELAVDPPDLAERRAGLAREQAGQKRLRAAAAAPVTFAGRRIMVEANIGSLAEARAAVAAGADGVGLLRTELLLPDQPELPDEDTQHALLKEIFAVLGERPVTVRVLDAGGDKPVRALRLDPVRNGFLGVRGWRWLAAHPDILRTQLRAICRAAAPADGPHADSPPADGRHDGPHAGGPHIDVMAPMITVAAEAAAFRDAVRAAAASLAADGLPHAPPARTGVMIEVPAAAVAADEIAAEADFLSVGTNDLIAYAMAADRTEPGVAGLADPAATAVWRLLEQICAGAATHGRPVAVCGELAADERFARRLAGLGVTSLSMAAGRIPAVKALLRQV